MNLPLPSFQISVLPNKNLREHFKYLKASFELKIRFKKNKKKDLKTETEQIDNSFAWWQNLFGSVEDELWQVEQVFHARASKTSMNTIHLTSWILFKKWTGGHVK